MTLDSNTYYVYATTVVMYDYEFNIIDKIKILHQYLLRVCPISHVSHMNIPPVLQGINC